MDQWASLVDESRLRFDFANNKVLKTSPPEDVYAICDDVIKQQLICNTQDSAQAEAKRTQCLHAVFGEMYSNTVRVVSIGQPIASMMMYPENSSWSKFST